MLSLSRMANRPKSALMIHLRFFGAPYEQRKTRKVAAFRVINSISKKPAAAWCIYSIYFLDAFKDAIKSPTKFISQNNITSNPPLVHMKGPELWKIQSLT